MLLEEEQRIINECIAAPLEAENSIKPTDNAQKDYFNKYIQLKKYLYKNETKFVELEQAHLKAVRQVYSLLNTDQKMKLIRRFILYSTICYIF